MKYLSIAAAAALLLASCSGGQKAPSVTVKVSNPADIDRAGEVVNTDAAPILERLGLTSDERLVVLDADGRQVAYQNVAEQGRLYFVADVKANATSTYTFTVGQPEEFPTAVTGRQYPERVDDIAWENEYSAYRLYGPALQASGERAYGYDVWTKNTPELVVEQRYMDEHHAAPVIKQLRAEGKTAEADSLNFISSYHFDHGKGLDCYKVGATLGGGAAGLYKDGQIVYPYCYTDYKIVAAGPLVFTVELVYEQRTLDGKTYHETRTITATKGSRLNECVVAYEGLDAADADVVAGLVVHTENPDYVVNKEKGYVAYADPTDPSQGGVDENGSIYVGIYAPDMTDAFYQPWGKQENPLDMKARGGADGHVLAKLALAPQGIRYYFGSSWSKYDMPDMASWEAYLDEFGQRTASPLAVEVAE